MPIIRAIVLSVIGLILVKNPEKLWKLECALGWKYGEVKNGYLVITRICGGICIFAGVMGLLS